MIYTLVSIIVAYLAVNDTEPADASHKLLLPDRNDIRKEEKDRAFISSFKLRKDLHFIRSAMRKMRRHKPALMLLMQYSRSCCPRLETYETYVSDLFG